MAAEDDGVTRCAHGIPNVTKFCIDCYKASVALYNEHGFSAEYPQNPALALLRAAQTKRAIMERKFSEERLTELIIAVCADVDSPRAVRAGERARARPRSVDSMWLLLADLVEVHHVRTSWQRLVVETLKSEL